MKSAALDGGLTLNSLLICDMKSAALAVAWSAAHAVCGLLIWRICCATLAWR